MAYAPARSCNAELCEGATDGAVWKPYPERGGFVSSPSNQRRSTFAPAETSMLGVIGPKGSAHGRL